MNTVLTIDQLTQFFMWCSIVNIALLAFAFMIVVLFKEKVVSIHSKLFNIPEESINLAMYYFFGFWKLMTYILFVIPWLCLYFIK